MKTLVAENIIKNLTLLVILIIAFPVIEKFLSASPIASDRPLAGDLLVAVSILAVTACFGNFAFTYEKMASTGISSRILAHATTGLLMLVIGLALEMSAVLSSFIIGPFPMLNTCWFLLYVASVLYDFWDLQRYGCER